MGEPMHEFEPPEPIEREEQPTDNFGEALESNYRNCDATGCRTKVFEPVGLAGMEFCGDLCAERTATEIFERPAGFSISLEEEDGALLFLLTRVAMRLRARGTGTAAIIGAVRS